MLEFQRGNIWSSSAPLPAELGKDRVVQLESVVERVEVGDRIAVRGAVQCRVENEIVGARTAGEGVVAQATSDPVRAAIPVDRVRTIAADQDVVAAIAGEDVAEMVASAVDVGASGQR